jgi:hypothetical protein
MRDETVCKNLMRIYFEFRIFTKRVGQQLLKVSLMRLLLLGMTLRVTLNVKVL